jgi:hypothetical protein
MSWQQKINKIKKKVHMFCHVEIPCHTMHPGGKADNLEIARGKSQKKKIIGGNAKLVYFAEGKSLLTY